MIADWRDDALCQGMDPRLFEYDPENYPTKRWAEWTSAIKQAQQACADCPVVLQCKKSANTADRENTVRGGLQPLNYIRAERYLDPNYVVR